MGESLFLMPSSTKPPVKTFWSCQPDNQKVLSHGSLTGIYLMSRVGRIFIHFRKMWTPFSGKWLFISLPISPLVCWTLSFWFIAALYMFEIAGLGLWYELQIFIFLVCHLFFDFAYCCFGLFLSVCHAEFFFSELNLSNISLIVSGFCIMVLKRLPHTDVIKEFPHDSLWYIYYFIFCI